MQDFRTKLSEWQKGITLNAKDFGISFKKAIVEQFNWKFLRVMGYILIIAVAISAIILSFMHSCRVGWWSVAIEVILIICCIISCVATEQKFSFKVFAYSIASVIATILLSYVIGTLGLSILPPKPETTALMTEMKITFGIICVALLSIAGFIFFTDYTEGLKNETWHNKTEYIIRILRKCILLAIGIYAIYAIVHYLSPLIA